MEYCIYIHKSPSGKVYIGQTCQKLNGRWKNGKGYSNNEYFTRAINKYGWKSFEHEVLFYGLNKEEADILEREYIKKYNSTDPQFGYNIEFGGYGKGKHSPETLRKMSEGHKGIPAWNKGVKMPQELKDHFSAIRKGKESSFKGKHHSEEAKRKMSESKNERKKPVLCVENNVIYRSLKDAEVNTGINRKNISAVCHGKKKTAGGFHWQFFINDNKCKGAAR